MTAKERAFKAEADIKDAVLGGTPYNERMRRDPFTRYRLKDKELGQEIRFNGYRTENERVSSMVDFNNKRDHSERDTKMIHNPNWRNPDKNKYLGPVCKDGYRAPFDTTYNNFPLKNNTSWRQHPIVRDEDGPNQYIEGLEKLGNDLNLRGREKQHQ